MIALSFFSGCLGLDLGLERAGIKSILACDFDKNCRETININRPELPTIDDILNYSTQQIRDIAGLAAGTCPDVIVGGPPCQAFSTAGKRAAFDDPRGNVFLHYIDLCLELAPKAIVIENVRGLLSAALKHRTHAERGIDYPTLSELEKPGSALMKVIKKLENSGYGVSFNLYNSANFGVPQKRERVILIALKNGLIAPFLKPTHSEYGYFGLPKWKTFKEAINGLDNVEHTHLKFSEKRLKYYRMLKSGEYWKHLPTEEIKKEAMGKSYFSGGGKTGFYRRLDWNKPSPTLVTHPAMPATDLAHPEENRPLSIQEYKRVQQFPDDWILSGTIIQQYKQIGNAVPVGLGKAVGELLTEIIQQKNYSSEDFNDFSFSRYKNTDHINWRKKFDGNNAQLAFKTI
jgi:DNA (cytosine-5)-methyltransferase 1